MEKDFENKIKNILELTRRQIKELAGDSSDDWFKINRYIYARLQVDEKKQKPKKIDLFDRQKGICWLCKDRIENIKDTDLHRINEKLGYDDINNVVLVHRICHQRMQMKNK